MSLFTVVVAWILLSLLLGACFSIGAGIGYRRGWEDRGRSGGSQRGSVHPLRHRGGHATRSRAS